jgi:Asp-tRNA(Asn)/Glu-tRNA(Gln) amidotransferase A subunit family amidase
VPLDDEAAKPTSKWNACFLRTEREGVYATYAQLNPMRTTTPATIAEMAKRVRAGDTDADIFVREALATIAATDDRLRAWVEVDPGAADAARVVDRTLPLAGVPFGVKDVIEMRGLPTRCGVDFLSDAPAQYDAWCVGALRKAGAIPIGKTETTSFAFSSHPAPTYNPWNAARTPGGSSAGSAAAVAAGHVPFALGTQTAGSTLRPASYNGVVGFKPTFGRVPTTGMWPLGPTCDHIGVIARTVADVEAVFAVLDPAFDPLPQTAGARILCDVDFYRELTDESGRALLTSLAASLRAAGIDVRAGAPPRELTAAQAAWQSIVPFEANAMLGSLIAGTPGRPLLHERIAQGTATSPGAYKAAFRERARLRAFADGLFGEADALLTLTAGPVPTRETTGNQSTQIVRTWTLLGNPSISVPAGFTSDGMPAGVQVVARHGNDASLLALARRIEAVVGPLPRPNDRS